jgi:hypothetical protein
MGLFSKMKQAVAGTDAGDIDNGRLGRAIITGLDISGTSITSGGVETRVCTFQMEVALDDTARYMAASRQRLPIWDLARIQPGQTTVAVRVDPRDPARVAISWNEQPPVVRPHSRAPTRGLQPTCSPAVSIAGPSSSSTSRWAW